jgi:predicted phage-related endonuclease
MDRPNTPVPDELAAVREQIKALETRENELKALLLANPDIRTGASWLAEVKTVETTRTDLKEMRANHADIVEQYTFRLPVTRVVLSGITDDGEVVSARKLRSAAQ